MNIYIYYTNSYKPMNKEIVKELMRNVYNSYGFKRYMLEYYYGKILIEICDTFKINNYSRKDGFVIEEHKDILILTFCLPLSMAIFGIEELFYIKNFKFINNVKLLCVNLHCNTYLHKSYVRSLVL